MTNRLSAIEGRLSSVRQLSTVVSAMRGIAAVRSREARQALDGIRAYAATIGTAIAEVLAARPAPPHTAPKEDGAHLLVLLMSEQGFVGTFNERLADAARQHIAASGGVRWEILVAGNRGAGLLAENALEFGWSDAMIEHAAQAGDLATRIADQLFQRIAQGNVAEVMLLHAEPGTPRETITQQRLAPFDYDRFPKPAHPQRPLMTMPPERLMEQLAQEFVFARISEAVILSYAAENEARTRAMTEANTNSARTLEELQQLYRLSRQEEITAEIIELGAVF